MARKKTGFNGVAYRPVSNTWAAVVAGLASSIRKNVVKFHHFGGVSKKICENFNFFAVKMSKKC
jgi:hypothetical protein